MLAALSFCAASLCVVSIVIALMLIMAALLSVCTKEQQHSVIQEQNFYKWIEELKNCRTSVTHEEGAGLVMKHGTIIVSLRVNNRV
jgi:hypothetical protein